jgi:hypothetical protein
MQRNLLGLLFGAVLVVSACSGGGAATATPGTGATATAVPGATDTPAAGTPIPTTAGGGGASDACGLITAEELASVMSATNVTTEPVAGDTSYCTYRAAGVLVAATSYNLTNADVVFPSFAGEAGATVVSGIGDKAVFSPSTATLFIVKGSKIVGITAGAGTMPIEQRLDLSKQLGAIAAGRL